MCCDSEDNCELDPGYTVEQRFRHAAEVRQRDDRAGAVLQGHANPGHSGEYRHVQEIHGQYQDGRHRQYHGGTYQGVPPA